VLKELKSSVGYSSDEFDVVAYGKTNAKRQTEVGANYYHRLSADFAVGTEVKFDVTSKDTDKKPTLAFGTAYRFTPDSVFKARYDTDGKLALSYAQQMNKTAKLLLSSTIDTHEPAGKQGTQFGFTLSLNG